MKPGVLAGVRCLLAGLAMLPRSGVRSFVALPLIINTVLFAGGIALAADYLDTALERALPDWLAFLEWIVWPLFVLSTLLLTFFTFTLVANLVGAPFNGFLAEAVAARLGVAGSGAPLAAGRLLREVAGALAGEVRKLSYFALLAVPVLVLSFVPGLQVAAPLLWFLFGAWALAVEYADFPLGNAGLAFPAQRRLLRRHRRAALGFGAGVALLTSVPGLNFVAMPSAVAGATILWHRHLRQDTESAL